jgi:hypothetical protein
MQNLFKRFIEPLTLRVDFKDPFWAVSPTQARLWLAGAVATDLAVQFVAGAPTLMTIASSVLTLLLFWFVPARLAGAIGGLYIGQAIGSLVVVTAASLSGVRMLVEVAGFAWWGWCLFAMAKMVLGYIRTPKAEML